MFPSRPLQAAFKEVVSRNWFSYSNFGGTYPEPSAPVRNIQRPTLPCPDTPPAHRHVAASDPFGTLSTGAQQTRLPPPVFGPLSTPVPVTTSVSASDVGTGVSACVPGSVAGFTRGNISGNVFGPGAIIGSVSATVPAVPASVSTVATSILPVPVVATTPIAHNVPDHVCPSISGSAVTNVPAIELSLSAALANLIFVVNSAIVVYDTFSTEFATETTAVLNYANEKTMTLLWNSKVMAALTAINPSALSAYFAYALRSLFLAFSRIDAAIPDALTLDNLGQQSLYSQIQLQSRLKEHGEQVKWLLGQLPFDRRTINLLIVELQAVEEAAKKGARERDD